MLNQRTALVIGAAYLVVLPALYWYAAQTATNPDPLIYSQVAKEMFAGKKLYAEILFDKGPLTPCLYGIPQSLFPRSYQAVALFGGMWVSLYAAAFLWTFRRVPEGALCCVGVITLFPLTFWDFAWPSTEQFSNLFVAANLLLAYRIARRGASPAECFAVGVATVFAFHVRQTAVFSAIVPLVAISVRSGSWRVWRGQVFWCACGAASAMVLVFGVVFLVSDLPSYLKAMFLTPRKYVGLKGTGIFSLFIFLFSSHLSVWLAITCAVAFFSKLRWLALVSLVVGVWQCVMPLSDHPHYWVGILPTLGLLIGIAFHESSLPRPMCAAVLGGALAVSLVPQAFIYVQSTAAKPNLRSYERIAAAVDNIELVKGALLVSGPLTSEAIQFASRRSPGHPIWTLWVLDPPMEQLLPEKWRIEKVLESYLAEPPAVIVVRTDYMKFATTTEVQQLPNQLRVIRALLDQKSYAMQAEVDNYWILTLKP